MKLIIGIILSLIIGIGLFIVVHILADKYAKDIFVWGYWVGFIVCWTIDIIISNFK